MFDDLIRTFIGKEVLINVGTPTLVNGRVSKAHKEYFTIIQNGCPVHIRNSAVKVIAENPDA